MDSKRPRLLVLTSTFPRWEGDTDPRFVEALSFELAEFFDVIVLVPHCKGALQTETFVSRGHSIEVRRFRYAPAAMETLAYEGGMLFRVSSNPLRLLLLPLFLASQALAAFRLQRKHRFDAIHAHWILPQAFVAAILRGLMRSCPPVLVTAHGGDLYALRGPVFERLKRWILSYADALTVVSHAMRDYCEERGFAVGKTIVQSMGVDLDRKFTPGNGDTVRDGLVYVGRLVEKKGVEYLVDAMAILAGSHPDVRLKIVGDGPLRQSLIDRTTRLTLQDRIQFVGSVPNEDVPKYLRSATVAVMPSVVAASGDQEGLGLSAVEALGCGCAVVASDLPAIRDTIINGETGLMAEPENGADLAEKIAVLLDDVVLRNSLAESGRQYALEKFNWSAVGSRYCGILRDLISGSR